MSLPPIQNRGAQYTPSNDRSLHSSYKEWNLNNDEFADSHLPPLSYNGLSLSTMVLEEADDSVLDELDGMLLKEYERFRSILPGDSWVSPTSPSRMLKPSKPSSNTFSRKRVTPKAYDDDAPPHRLPEIEPSAKPPPPADNNSTPSRPAWETNAPLSRSGPTKQLAPITSPAAKPPTPDVFASKPPLGSSAAKALDFKPDGQRRPESRGNDNQAQLDRKGTQTSQYYKYLEESGSKPTTVGSASPSRPTDAVTSSKNSAYFDYLQERTPRPVFPTVTAAPAPAPTPITKQPAATTAPSAQPKASSTSAPVPASASTGALPRGLHALSGAIDPTDVTLSFLNPVLRAASSSSPSLAPTKPATKPAAPTASKPAVAAPSPAPTAAKPPPASVAPPATAKAAASAAPKKVDAPAPKQSSAPKSSAKSNEALPRGLYVLQGAIDVMDNTLASLTPVFRAAADSTSASPPLKAASSQDLHSLHRVFDVCLDLQPAHWKSLLKLSHAANYSKAPPLPQDLQSLNLVFSLGVEQDLGNLKSLLKLSQASDFAKAPAPSQASAVKSSSTTHSSPSVEATVPTQTTTSLDSLQKLLVAFQYVPGASRLARGVSLLNQAINGKSPIPELASPGDGEHVYLEVLMKAAERRSTTPAKGSSEHGMKSLRAAWESTHEDVSLVPGLQKLFKANEPVGRSLDALYAASKKQ